MHRFVQRCTPVLLSLVTYASFVSAQTGDPFHPDSLRATVSFLANDSMQGRWSGSKECLAAARYIARRFADAGLEPLYNNRFLWSFSKDNGLRTHNVLAVIPGGARAHEWILFSAHYDHIGTEGTAKSIGAGLGFPQRDKIFNGANDNASGVAGLIAIAEQAAGDTGVERTLVFAAFSGEELGLLGSYAAADTMPVGRIVAQVNLEMLGRPMKSLRGRPYISGSDYSTLRNILNAELTRTDSASRDYFVKDLFERDNIFYRSDNYPFYRRGVLAAHTISTTDPTDMYYHTVDDELETLDFSSMSEVLRKIYRACGPLMDGTATPTKPAKRRARRP